ncbi:unnamed protein product [Anisakis simplex]|uniref:Neur_chan_LBD domain-containing protein n=1 Tax=Anisakis simplex TaxID=6269 RepID=A0A0M3J478_ANISI|nr:unnamed protein product [Anisakis simplex]
MHLAVTNILILFDSDGYTADQVRYVWSTGEKQALKLHKIRLPDFQIKEAFVTSQTEMYATGNYSRLYVCFVLSRTAGFCFLQLIIPSTAVVITSWVSLWMENETSFQVGSFEKSPFEAVVDFLAFQRLRLCSKTEHHFDHIESCDHSVSMACSVAKLEILSYTFVIGMKNECGAFQDMISIILTITFLLFSYNEVMPRVSYIKAMDVYLGEFSFSVNPFYTPPKHLFFGVCFCIVFLSLIKLATLKYMRQRLRITRYIYRFQFYYRKFDRT